MCSVIHRPWRSTLFPYTTLFRSGQGTDTAHPGADGDIAANPHRVVEPGQALPVVRCVWRLAGEERPGQFRWCEDRKSTRLNSSHQIISYAVFCLKNKRIIRATKG